MWEDCSDLPLNERHKSCICHTVYNAVDLRKYLDWFYFYSSQQENHNDMSGYLSQSCSQLLPCTVSKVWTCLVSSKTLIDLQVMIMIITCNMPISLFPLPGWYGNQEVHSLVGCLWSCWKCHGYLLESVWQGWHWLAWVTLTIWYHDEYLELCLVCILLIYIHLTNFKVFFLHIRIEMSEPTV